MTEIKNFFKRTNWWIVLYSAFVTYMSIASYGEYGIIGFINTAIFLTVTFMAGWWAKEKDVENEASDANTDRG